jgi:hypothetical protein
MGKNRLHVEFDNGHVGKFIDWRDAELVPTNDIAASSDINAATSTNDNDIGELSQLLEHMAFTTATLISSERGNPARIGRLLHVFDQQVRTHTDTLSNARLNSSSTHQAARFNVNRVPPEEL